MSLVGPRASVLVSKEEVSRRCGALFSEVGVTVGLEDDGRLNMHDLREYAATTQGGFALAALTHFEVPPHVAESIEISLAHLGLRRVGCRSLLATFLARAEEERDAKTLTKEPQPVQRPLHELKDGLYDVLTNPRGVSKLMVLCTRHMERLCGAAGIGSERLIPCDVWAAFVLSLTAHTPRAGPQRAGDPSMEGVVSALATAVFQAVDWRHAGLIGEQELTAWLCQWPAQAAWLVSILLLDYVNVFILHKDAPYVEGEAQALREVSQSNTNAAMPM